MLDHLRLLKIARLAATDGRGASAGEYGLLVAGIAAVVVLVIVFLSR